jgi:4-hydroxythreonine-4-phosphate dehydrogenase
MLPLVVTPGMGIGPEVTARALAAEPPAGPVVLAGRSDEILPELAALGLTAEVVSSIEAVPAALSNEALSLSLFDPGDRPGEPTEVAAIRLAAEACMHGKAAGLVTGPIHKARLVAGGFTHRGHTDFLGTVCGVPDPIMAFVGGELRVALVTHHLPLMQVGAALSTASIARTARVAHSALCSELALDAPRIVVCGLNPHAGEGGVLGTEELTTIGPACDALRAEGRDVVGPVSAETAFLMARRNEADLIVAMYHDQGLAPLKAVDFGRSVNWTLGLPIVRTSVDHGTADHLVGTGRAEPDSMVAALRLARDIIERRHRHSQAATSPSV